MPLSGFSSSHRTSVLTGLAHQASWQINRDHLDSWCCWGGEIVVYDDCSGATMKLDIITSEIFRFMLQRPATEAAITQHLAAALDLAVDGQLRHITRMALHRLREAALVRAVDAPTPLEPA